MKEMKLINPAFRYNLHNKYYNHLMDEGNGLKNEHIEKFLWFLFDEGRYQRMLFEDVASNYTLRMH